MKIEIVAISEEQKTGTNGKSYTQLEVVYKNDQGAAQTKKIMSFTNPGVFKALKEAKSKDILDVTAVKNEKSGYWDWTAVNKGGNDSTQTGNTKVVGSNYETREERQQRQVYIIRQSSVASAVNLLTTNAKSTPSVDEVIEVARKIESYVFSTDVFDIKDDVDDIL